jgi:cysteinyl-tRNA synthetase
VRIRFQAETIHNQGIGLLLIAVVLTGGYALCVGGCDGGAGVFVDPDAAIVETNPADGATGVSIDTVITITFAQEADPDSLDGWLEPDVDVDLAWSASNTVLTATPSAPLAPTTHYAVSIGDLTFADGSELVSQFDFEFTTAGETDVDEGSPLTLDEVQFWGYQIQGIDADGAIDSLAESRYDMLVLEPTRTDAELLDFDTKAMVDRLKATKAHDGIHRKLIIAYVDIGEAEDWRWYWTWSKEPENVQIPEETNLPHDWPEYIIARDPDGWVGNYPVAYWNSQWKDIIIYGENQEPAGARDYTSTVDELMLDGFDGIYLDWVEGFENEHVIAAAEAKGLDAAAEMIAFIGEIREYAQERNPGFVVIQQNASALIDGRENLLDYIDGIAQEGVWYDGGATDDWDELEDYWKTEAQLVGEYVGFLDQYLDADVPVFVCEYALEHNADDAYQRAAEKGYVPYVTRRSLGRLTDTPPPGYDADDDNGDNLITPASKWALWTQGTQLRGANIWQSRNYVELHGAGTLGDAPVGPPFTQEDFDNLAALGANYVNISHPGLFTETPPYVLDEEIQDNLDHLLDLIAEADMFAVITFRTGPGRSEFWAVWGEDTEANPDEGWFAPSYYNNAVWENEDAQQGWADMWRYTAQRYGDNLIVVGYDLMCEPNAEEIYFGIWGDPTQFYPAQAGATYDWNHFYPDIVAAIREADSETPVLVQPMGYGSVAWLPYLQPTDDSRTVYTVHQYEPSSYTHQYPPLDRAYPGEFDVNDDGHNEQIDKAYLDNLLTTVDEFSDTYDVPVAVNEYGAIRWEPGAAQFMDDLMDLFEQRGMNHALWEWHSSWAPFAWNDAFDFRNGPDPENHASVNSSDLIDVVGRYWEDNRVRPSNVSFED